MAREVYKTVSRGVIQVTYKSGRQAYRVTFKYKGQWCTETLSDIEISKRNQRYVENLLAEIKAAIAKNTFNYQEYFPESKKAALFGCSTSTRTIGEDLQTWLKDIKKSQKHSVYKTYRSRVNQLSPIHHYRLRDLTPRIIRDMVRGWDVALITARNNLTPLRAIIDEAMIDGVLQRNPLDGIRLRTLVKRQPKKSKPDPFELHEIESILDKAQAAYGEEVRNFFALFMFQGLRTGEMFGLKWADIDFQKYTAHIQRSVVATKLQEETKTDSGDRIIDLTCGGYDALTRQKKHTYMRSEFVFCRFDGSYLRKYENVSDKFNAILKSLKLRNRKQYQCRHTFISHKLSYGENLFYMAKQVGHTDAQMLLKVYAKWIESALHASEMPSVFMKKSYADNTQNASKKISK